MPRAHPHRPGTDNTPACPIRHALTIIGGKWKLPIICLLFSKKPRRYGEIRRKLGNVTDMMLAQSLKELEADGIVRRKQYVEIPPKVEYSLTKLGFSLYESLHTLAHWGVDHMELTSAGPPACLECRGAEELALHEQTHQSREKRVHRVKNVP